MTFDVNVLRSVIEEVMKEMNVEAAPAAPVSPVAVTSKLSLTEGGDAKKGVAADEVVIGLAPAFAYKQHKTMIDLPHDKVLREIIAGIEEEGMNYRFVKVYNSTDLGIIASQGSKLAGSGICVAMQSRGTTVIHQRDLLPLDNLELFPQSPLIELDMYRTIGKNTAKYGKGESPEPVEILNDYMVPSKFLIKSTLMHFKEGKMANRDMAPIDLEVKF